MYHFYPFIIVSFIKNTITTCKVEKKRETLRFYTLAIIKISHSKHLPLFFSHLYSPYFYMKIKRINIQFFSKENMAFYFLKIYAAYQAMQI